MKTLARKKRSQNPATQVMDEISPIAESTTGTVIQFIGKKERLNKETGKIEIVYREATTKRRNGSRVIELPSSTEQRRGFTHPDAEFLLTAYPKDFKRKKSKGEN